MLNYIRAEFYKVLRRKYTWITLAVVLGLEGLLVAGWVFTNVNGNNVDFYTGAGMLCLLLPVGFYATLLTCDMVFADQYKNCTMKNEVSFGIPRRRIYLGKLAVQLAVSLLFMAVMAAFYLALCYLALYHDPEADGTAMQIVGYCLATALPLWTGVLACTSAFRFFIKNDLWASMASLCVFAVAPTVLELAGLMFRGGLAGTVIHFLYQYMPTVLLDRAPSVVGVWEYCGQAWLVGAVWFAVFTALGLFSFSKKEIK